MQTNASHTSKWYAIRVTYSREKKLKEFLDARGIENFLPMHYKLVKKKKKMIKVMVPVVHNLLFVKTTRFILDKIKKETEGTIPMRYMMDKATGKPIIVPEVQMCSFIIIAGSLDEQLLYLDKNIDAVLDKGDKIRVLEGKFAQAEGVVVRIKIDRRVVVSIKGVIAVATAFIAPQFLQKIE